jgi:hypothetical protein
MNVRFGDGPTQYGPGVSIELTGDEVALAIEAWLLAHNVRVYGARTITVNRELCEFGSVYADPGAFVMVDGARWNGNGKIEL